MSGEIDDFVAMMRRAGRLQLGQRHGLSMAAADDVTDMVLGIVNQVTATMRAEMN
jgi:hypothetical protein